MLKSLLTNRAAIALAGLVLLGGSIASCAADRPKPLRVLLITGGCCHEYDSQKDVLKQGLEERANVFVDQVHSRDKSTKPPLAILGNSDYAKGYDLVIHDECAADVSDEKTVLAVLKPHLEGLPAVNLHCGVHSYRIGNPNDFVILGTAHGLWFEYLGLQSSGHGPQAPIGINFTNANCSVGKGLGDWTTTDEELYNNIRVFDTATPLAYGAQIVKQKDGASKTNNSVVIWVNKYGLKQTKVFSTTIGHNTATVGDPRYLDLVARGVLWATGHLRKDGTPAKGYGPIETPASPAKP